MSLTPYSLRQAVRNHTAVEMLQVLLGPGEAETLVLAEEVACPLVFMDERLRLA
jgi:predicted nucleic acid-binding protein